MKIKYRNFKRERKSVRLTNKVMQDVLDLKANKIYTECEVTNVYRQKNTGELAGRAMINGAVKRVKKSKSTPHWIMVWTV